LKDFLAKKEINNLTEVETKLTNRELEKREELDQVWKEIFVIKFLFIIYFHT